jgi:hypothetical protein
MCQNYLKWTCGGRDQEVARECDIISNDCQEKHLNGYLRKAFEIQCKYLEKCFGRSMRKRQYCDIHCDILRHWLRKSFEAWYNAVVFHIILFNNDS